MKNRKSILLVVLLLAVGFAAVSTTLYINGSTNINPNQDDFNVYYSNALVNGIQDLSVITDDTHIVFETELSTLGEKYVLDYEVKNSSKNYDAELTMSCTSGNDYLNITNEFDDNTILEARDSREGKLTLELKKSNAGEDLSVSIECVIDANAIERDTLAKPYSTYEIGDEIVISNEVFNVIAQTEDTVTMLAQYNIGTDYKQTKTANRVTFSDGTGWEYAPGPKEIDIQVWSTNPKNYINEYIKYLQVETNSNSISGDLITITELKGLGCLITDDYSNKHGLVCANSQYANWLINGQFWWTRSAYSGNATHVWYVYTDGVLDYRGYTDEYGVRPVITISKDALV